MSKSNLWETAVLNSSLRGQSFPVPSNVYVGLLGADPGESGAVGEPTGNDYARVAVAATTAAWTTPAEVEGAMETSNAQEIVFPVPTGAGWGVLSRFGLFLAAVGGEASYYGDLSQTQTVVAGNPLRFPPGSLKIRES